MKGIYKSFGANDVLRDVSFTLNGGEICALLGENGAGKSTLMNILGGVHHADQGQILLDGKRVAFQTPADSLKHGIAFIHQELNLVNDLAIYENMFIGHELRKKNRFLDSAAMIAKTNEVDVYKRQPVHRCGAASLCCPRRYIRPPDAPGIPRRETQARKR